MGNTFGNNFRFTIFGQSHAPVIGVTMEGLPSGFEINQEKLYAFMQRRAPGQSRHTTARKEEDRPEFVTGLVDGKCCGAPVTALIFNKDMRSKDYSQLKKIPRPGHADYSAMIKYGESRDVAGGGQFSGRLTAPLCIAGGTCLQLLDEMGIKISARIVSIAGETEEKAMADAIDAVISEGDSVGGIIECICENVPAGVGEPMFGGMENRIAQAAFGIPAIKGIEFGAGFAAADKRGSENNDPFVIENGKVTTEKNDHGGILGGITSGMPIVFRVVVKPTPSISRPQRSVDMSTGENTILEINGRHDPCIVPRAVPCVEAAAAVAIYDAVLESRR